MSKLVGTTLLALAACFISASAYGDLEDGADASAINSGAGSDIGNSGFGQLAGDATTNLAASSQASQADIAAQIQLCPGACLNTQVQQCDTVSIPACSDPSSTACMTCQAAQARIALDLQQIVANSSAAQTYQTAGLGDTLRKCVMAGMLVCTWVTDGAPAGPTLQFPAHQPVAAPMPGGGPREE